MGSGSGGRLYRPDRLRRLCRSPTPAAEGHQRTPGLQERPFRGVSAGLGGRLVTPPGGRPVGGREERARRTARAPGPTEVDVAPCRCACCRCRDVAWSVRSPGRQRPTTGAIECRGGRGRTPPRRPVPADRPASTDAHVALTTSSSRHAVNTSALSRLFASALRDAADAVRGGRAQLKPFERDRRPTALTGPGGAELESDQRRLDLLEPVADLLQAQL